MHVQNCPDCGWPVMAGRLCPRCSSGAAISCAPMSTMRRRPGPSATGSSGAGSPAPSRIALVVLLALMGIFWMALGMFGLRTAFWVGEGTGLLVAVIATLDLIMGGYIFSTIRSVLRLRLTMVGQMLAVGAMGVVWSLISWQFFGAWPALFVLPLHVVAATVAVAEQKHFSRLEGAQENTSPK